MADEMLPLRLFTLGAPEVCLGDHPVTFSTRKTLALLIYLAVENRLQPREHLATLLWPEASPERSHASLRNTLGHLQAALRRANGQKQTSYLYITHDSLGLNPDANLHLDLRTVDQGYALARSDRTSRMLPKGSASLPLLQSAAAYQQGDFLAGFSLGDAPGFDDWAAIQREVWRRRLGLILDRLSEIQFASGEFASTTETASRWIALDALNEAAYRRKMRAHFAAGERGQALETYEACRARLAAELGIEPEPDTVALAERIRTQLLPTYSPAHRIVPQPRHPDTSVAFLGNLFTGRDREYQALVNSYEQAAAGQPQLVVLRGEAGIGKTRLARKFLTWASEQGIELLQGSAFESGSHLPFQPLVEALRLRLESDNPPKDLLADVWRPALSQLMPEWPDPASALPRAAGEAEIEQVQLFEPLVQLTLALGQRDPLVLFIDDLQWTDSATLDWLQYAMRRWQEIAAQKNNAVRIILLVSLRSEAMHPMTQPLQTDGPQGLIQWLARLTRELTPVHIELEPLSERETVQLVLSILSPPAADFAKWLYAETRGQPFYLMETLKDLLERRVLHPKRRSEGQWTFAVDAVHNLGQAVRIPSTVHAVIRSRLNRLSPNAFSLLAGGAVLEQRLSFQRLCAISNVSEDLALPAMDELISGRLLLEAALPGAASEYTFVNEMLRDVVYTEAGDARRRLFHQRALEILAAEGDSAAVLAHHALAAGLAQAAFRYSLAAGREALRILAVGEAIVHFESARQFVREASLSEMPAKADIRDLFLQLDRVRVAQGINSRQTHLVGQHKRSR